MSEEQREPIPVEALPFTGVYSGCQHRIGTGNIVRTLNGYCWDCSMAAKEFQQIVISCLPIALEEELKECPDRFHCTSVIERAIFAAGFLRDLCLAWAANERKK